MRHPVHIVRAAIAGAIVLGSAAPIGSQTPASSLTNWREVRSIKMEDSARALTSPRRG